MEKGAATSVYVATQPGLATQQCHYYVDCRAKQSSALSRSVMTLSVFGIVGNWCIHSLITCSVELVVLSVVESLFTLI